MITPHDQLARMRVDYKSDELSRRDLAPTWHEQLIRWLTAARAAGVAEPNAMVLATADPEKGPSSRTVLCKDIDAYGVVFYTNLTSAKSRELRHTPQAAATFPWYAQYRQVHVQGRVEPVGRAATEAYWVTRPRGSQLGAWASAQSTEVPGRIALDTALDAVTRKFSDADAVPVPPHWGGWRLVPLRVEFWQGRSNRMHDRLRYERSAATGEWHVHRLAP